MNIIGMDLGTSLAKLIECDEQGKLINKILLGEKNPKNALEKFVGSCNIDMKNIGIIVATGVGASKIDDSEINGIKVVKENEFLSMASGGIALSGKEKAITASMGTGTAFVRVEGEDIKHLGGTGVGGGTLLNLCNRFMGTKSFSEIVEIAEGGDLGLVDLRIKDITTEPIPRVTR